MIEPEVIAELSEKYQTTEQNIVREFCQHLFLSHLYLEKGAQQLLFKGGTALRLIWGSPRFSEDLDFSSFKITASEIESLVEGALLPIERSGMTASIIEAKKTSGGYLAILEFKWSRFSSQIQLEISFRGGAHLKGTVVGIASDFIPNYTLVHLRERDLVEEKIKALLTRGKPRDFYDLYFILRKGMDFKEIFRKDKSLKESLLSKVKKEKLNIKNELKLFLPVNQHNLLKNFSELLAKELEKNLA